MKLISFEKNGEVQVLPVEFAQGLTVEDFIKAANRGAEKPVRIIEVKEMA